jgi:hypothetical protein
MKIQQTKPFRYWITSIILLLFSFNSSASVDLSVDSILSPVSDCGISTLSFVEVKIHNHDSVPISNFPISYRINGGAPVTETITSSILGGNSFNYTFTSTANLQTNGVYEIQVYVALSGDSIQMNDTLNKTVVNGYLLQFNPTPPYYKNDFEGTVNNWESYGQNSSWEIDTPTTTYVNGVSYNQYNAYVTKANGNYNANEFSYLETPCFDLSKTTNDWYIDMRFDLLYSIEADSDKVWVELSLNGGADWDKVMPPLIGSVNFYSTYTDSAWHGLSNGGAGFYIPVINDFQGIGLNSKVKFRFVFKSNGTIQSDGFAIDNFIFNPHIVGLNKINSSNSNIKLHPNPAKNNVTVSINNVNSGIYEMTIEDLKGQQVMNDLINVSNGNTSKVIDVSQFESGVYFVKVVNGSSIITKKLVVN